MRAVLKSHYVFAIAIIIEILRDPRISSSDTQGILTGLGGVFLA